MYKVFLTFRCNCRMVLKYLIPVKLSLGVMPSKLLLEQYNLLEVCQYLPCIMFFVLRAVDRMPSMLDGFVHIEVAP